MFSDRVPAAPAAPAAEATRAGRLPAASRLAGAANAARVERVFDSYYVQRPRRWLIALLLAYLSAALLYATLTPAWQNPDEPAHYNYIRHIATKRSLPVLRDGDFDQGMIALLQEARFASIFSIDSLRYESYQPPLYYLSAAPVFWATNGDLLALRVYNVLVGLVSLVLLYLCLELVFPNKPLIPLGATAFAALLPMHVAVNASVTNDGLAELLTMASSLLLLHWLKPRFYPAAARAGAVDEAAAESDSGWRRLLLLGVLLGLGLVTKVYAYAVLPMYALVVVWATWRGQRSWRGVGAGLARALVIVAPAVLIALPMWLRNTSLYGAWDLLALKWHDHVVAGQMTTEQYIYRQGTLNYFERAFGLTFRSFWGMFGWLTVAMDLRIYQVALFFCGVLFLGLLWASVRLISGPPDTDMDAFQTAVIVILGLLLVAVAGSFVWYNLKFVQHQGRYFFWGMLGIGTVVALAWRELMHPLQGTISGLIALALAGSMAVSAGISEMLDLWSVLFVGVLGAFLLLQPFLLIGTPFHHPWSAAQRALSPLFGRPRAAGFLQFVRFVAWASPFLLLYGLNLAVPFLYILPQLAG